MISSSSQKYAISWPGEQSNRKKIKKENKYKIYFKKKGKRNKKIKRKSKLLNKKMIIVLGLADQKKGSWSIENISFFVGNLSRSPIHRLVIRIYVLLCTIVFTNVVTGIYPAKRTIILYVLFFPHYIILLRWAHQGGLKHLKRC